MMMITYDDDMNGIYYKVRPSSIYTSAPMFSFSDRKGQSSSTSSRQSILVSYPMFLKYSGLKSVRSVNYERLVIKMVDGLTIDDQANLVKLIKKMIDPNLKYQLNFIT